MLKRWICAGITAAAIVVPTAALALPVDWSVDVPVGDTSSSSVITGTFTFDSATNAVSNVALERLWEGNRPPEYSYNIGKVTASSLPYGDINSILFFESSGGDETGRAAATLTFQTNLDDIGGSRSVIMVVEGFCRDSTCTEVSGFNRYKVGTAEGVPQVGAPPAPASIPTLSEWAMILLGVGLAGGAALMIQRRRMA